MARALSGLRGTGWAVGAVALAVGLVGCAAAPPTSGPRRLQPDDVKMLAGPWLGATNVQGERSTNIEGVIYESGSFFIAPCGGTATQVPGQMKIVDGGVVYETPTSEGKITFEEATTEWVWKWHGRTKIGDRAVAHELRRSK
jgi:hypothetical protein